MNGNQSYEPYIRTSVLHNRYILSLFPEGHLQCCSCRLCVYIMTDDRNILTCLCPDDFQVYLYAASLPRPMKRMEGYRMTMYPRDHAPSALIRDASQDMGVDPPLENMPRSLHYPADHYTQRPSRWRSDCRG